MSVPVQSSYENISAVTSRGRAGDRKAEKQKLVCQCRRHRRFAARTAAGEQLFTKNPQARI